MPSLISSLKAAICIFPYLVVFALIAASSEDNGESPPVHPSPYISIVGSILSSSVLICFIVSISCNPIKSNLNPSI